MVSTRMYAQIMRKRDRDDTETQLLDPIEAATALEEAEATRCLRAKKKKDERWQCNHPPFENIMPEIITNIMIYLDDSQDVYNFSKCAKFIRDAVTPEVVVRSAVFGGGRSREALACVMRYVQNRSIHTPSKLRLLKLVNGKRCERMESCFGLNLVSKQPQSLPKKSGNRPFGLCICQCCVTGLSQSGFSWRSEIANDPKADVLAIHDLSRVMTQPQSEWVTNDAIGPVVLMQKIKQVQKTYTDDDEKIQALVAIHEDLTSDFDEDFREHLVDVYMQAESEYYSFVDAKNAVRENKARAKIADRVNKKKANVGALLEEIEKALEGCRRKACILRGSYNSINGHFELTLGPARALLGPLLDAPSSATKKKVHAACTVVMEVFNLLDAHNFFGVGSRFLANFPRRDGASVLALHNYCTKKSTWQQLLQKQRGSYEWYPFFDYSPFLSALQEGNLAKALFLATRKEERRSAFVDYVTRVEGSSVRNRFRVIAERIWNSSFRSMNTFEDYKATFQALKDEYQNVSQNIKGYLQHPNTVTFLALPSNYERNGYTRQMAVDEVWKFAGYQKTHISNGNFNDLLSCHKRCYGVGGSIRNLVGW